MCVVWCDACACTCWNSEKYFIISGCTYQEYSLQNQNATRYIANDIHLYSPLVFNSGKLQSRFPLIRLQIYFHFTPSPETPPLNFHRNLIRSFVLPRRISKLWKRSASMMKRNTSQMPTKFWFSFRAEILCSNTAVRVLYVASSVVKCIWWKENSSKEKTSYKYAC